MFHANSYSQKTGMIVDTKDNEVEPKVIFLCTASGAL
jgi:hypothetical protein